MRLWLLALLAPTLVGCRCGDATPLVPIPICGDPCYDGIANNAGVGICAQGVIECDPEGNFTCVGSVYPAESETCNGEDDNCNGVVDENSVDGLVWFRDADSDGYGTGTLTVKACRLPDGFSARDDDCNDSNPNINPGRQQMGRGGELCNGFDDDCDLDVDEVENLDLTYCYNAPEETLMYPNVACRPGFQQCQFGQVVCSGEVLPSVEVCDDLDNDCDGQVNEGLDGTASYDFVFILDESGSMQDGIDAVKSASDSFAIKYNSSNYKFALVLAPPSNMSQDNTVSVYQNLDTAMKFRDAMQGQRAGSSWTEPTYTALIEVCTKASDLKLAWTPLSTKIVILFTDEKEYDGPSEADAAAACSRAGITVYAFVEDAFDYDAIAPGRLYSINDSATQIADNLDRLVALTCN